MYTAPHRLHTHAYPRQLHTNTFGHGRLFQQQTHLQRIQQDRIKKATEKRGNVTRDKGNLQSLVLESATLASISIPIQNIFALK